jgi:hypothetical protein
MAKKKTALQNGSAGKPPSGEIAFHYIKSNQFRVIYGDGAIGGPSPDAQNIHFAIYNERMPIPRLVVNTIADGKITGEVNKEARQGVVREVEVDVIMSLDDAETLSKWLAKTVSNLRSQLAGKSSDGGSDE